MATKLIMFDFWGTLCETGTFSPIQQTKNILWIRTPYPEYVKKLEKSFMQQHYDNWNIAFEAVCKEFSIDSKQFVIDKLIGVWNKAWLFAKLYPETEKVLKELREEGYKVVLISNMDNFTKDKIIEKFNLSEYFDAMYFSCDLEKNKAESYEDILKKHKVSKDETVMVGDSLESDILSAQKAGIKAVLVDRRDKREFSPKIKSLEELKQFL